MRSTQKSELFKIWAREQIANPARFFYGYDFIKGHDFFIGYKAPTRFSELCVDHPEMIESKMEGKYRVGRIKLDEIFAEMFPNIPEDYLQILRDEKNKK